MSAFVHSVAVIIGINQYGGGIPPLSTAVNDAQALAQLLEGKHHYKVVQLLDTHATRSALYNLLDTVLPREVHPDDRLLFYFAGHGSLHNGEDGPEGYVIPLDVTEVDTKNYLPMAYVQAALSALPCRHFLGILDCCFAGAFRWSSTRDLSTVPEVIHKERYERFIQDPAWQVITSAGYDQKAWDVLSSNADRGQIDAHSPFATALLAALAGQADRYPPAANGTPAGDGVMTATELYLYVRDCVEPATEGQRRRQTPGLWPLKKHDKGEYIFLTPGHSLNLPPAPPLDASQNPYRGLQSFEEEHHDVFFGRQALIDGTEDTPGLYTSVQNHPVTVVLGASGSGKSSLVKAGLLPHVRQIADAADPPQWRILPPLRPGGRPFQALQTLLQEQVLGTLDTKAADGYTSEHLVARMAAWCRQHPTAKLLLVIDQLEEVLTVCQDQQERENFCTFLAQALDQYPEQLRLVLTLRSDFEPQLQDTALKACWQKVARFVVRPMTRAELREAIEEPAAKRVMYFHSDDPKNPLVDQLITEVADMPGALPLLSFTLSELYLKYLERQKVARDQGDTIDRAITEADYKALGGVARSLTQRAEQEYEALVHQDPAYAHTIRHVMLRMVAGSGGEVARRQVPVSELVYPPGKNERVQEVIQRFSAARLIVEGKNTAGNPYVEPAHDVLVRGWHRLEAWQKEQGESVILQRQVTPAAEEWHRQQKARFLWNANPRLDLLKQVLHADDNWLNQVEGEFVQRSVKKKRQNTLVGWSIAGSVICVLSAILLVVFIQLQQTDLREKAARVRTLNQPIQKLMLAIEATGQSQSILKPFLQSAFGQVQSSLAYAIEVARERNAIELKELSSVAISRDGQYVATSNRDGRLSLWNLQGDEISKHDGIKGVNAISFSPDSQTILIEDDDKQLHLWDWKSNLMQDFPVSEVSDDNIKATFIPEESMMVTRSKAGLHLRDWKGNLMQDFPKGHIMMDTHSKAGLHLWDGKSKQTRDLPLPEGEKQRMSEVSRAAFSPDGQKIVGLFLDTHTKPVRLWNLPPQAGPVVDFVDFSTSTEGLSAEGFTGGGVSMPNMSTAASYSISNDYVAFTSDGQKIVSSSTDSNKGLVILTLWNLGGQVLDQLSFYSTDGISISADGKYAVAGQEDKVKLWDIGGKAIAEFSSGEEVNAVAISHDGQTIAGGDRLWNLQGDSITVAHNRNEVVSLAAISHDGKTIAGSIDGRVRLWDAHGTLMRDFPAYTFEVESIALSADGHTIVTSGQDALPDELPSSQEIRLWDRQGNLITQNFESL
jgi:WD40 repeat protein